MLSILAPPDSRPHPTLYNTLPHIMHTLLYIYGDIKSRHYNTGQINRVNLKIVMLKSFILETYYAHMSFLTKSRRLAPSRPCGNDSERTRLRSVQASEEGRPFKRSNRGQKKKIKGLSESQIYKSRP